MPVGITEELYNLQIDPYELDSLANDPTYAVVKSALEARLDELLAE